MDDVDSFWIFSYELHRMGVRCGVAKRSKHRFGFANASSEDATESFE